MKKERETEKNLIRWKENVQTTRDLPSMFYIIFGESQLPDNFLALLPVPQHGIPQLSQDGRLQLIVHH